MACWCVIIPMGGFFSSERSACPEATTEATAADYQSSLQAQDPLTAALKVSYSHMTRISPRNGDSNGK